MRRKLFSVFLGAVLVLVAACDEPTAKPGSAAETQPGINEVRHKLEDGRTVVCLLWDNQRGSASVGGLSCDWANAR